MFPSSPEQPSNQPASKFKWKTFTFGLVVYAALVIYATCVIKNTEASKVAMIVLAQIGPLLGLIAVCKK